MLQSIREHLDGRVTKSDGIRLASSLVLALLLWGWVTTAQDPERNRTFANVEITVEDLSGDLQVVSSLPTASITLNGPRSVIEDISPAEVTAHLNLEDVTSPGTRPVPIIISVPEGVWDQEVTPDPVTIEIERTITEQFPLNYQQQGEPDAAVIIDEVELSASEVTVRGPQSDVARVNDIILPVDLGDRTRDFRELIEAVALDEDGQPVPEVEITPASVEATINVTSRGKNIAVIAQLVGEPAQGFEVVDRQIIPNTVLVDGPEEMLDELVAIQTEPVDVSNVSTVTNRTARLVGIPEGVRVVDPSDGTVEVVIQVRQRGVSQSLPGQRVVVTNLAPGLVAEVNPGDVVINVVASEETLAQIPGSEIEVQVDAAGLGPGTYSLVPRVVVPPNAQWLSVEPDVVTLTISVAERSTPIASPVTEASPRASPISSD